MITLRVATVSDAPLLRRWDEDPDVIDSDSDTDDWNWDLELARTPQWREQLIAELDGRPIGVLQIIDPLVSNTRAIVFYQRLGFHPVEQRRFNDDDCWVHRIDRADFERELSQPRS
jgi:hypothetical protein